jgi:hypothetical protein
MMTESCTQFSIGDKVMFTDDYSEWWVLSLYPNINSLVCITTKEDRDTRRTFKPHQLEILDGMP